MFGWKSGSAPADHHQQARAETPVADEAVQVSQETPVTENMEHQHRHTMGAQEDGVLYQEGKVIGERHMVPGAEQAMHYLDGIPHEQTSSTIHSTPTTYLQQETVQTPVYSQETVQTPIYTQETVQTPVYSQATRVVEPTPSPSSERTLAVYEAPRTEAPAASTTLVTVKSISAEERDRQIHEENMRKAQLQEETMRIEAATFMERQKRDTVAYMQGEEAKALAKYEKEMTNAAFREAQVQKKAADMCAEAAAIRKKAEIAAQQKLEFRRNRAKTLAEEALATAKVRTTAIQKGDVKAELTHSWTKKFSRKLRF